MKAHQKILTCLISLLLVSVVLVSNAQKPAKQIPETDVSQFPILDYEKKSNSRSKKREKYNNRYAPRITETSDTITLTNDWDVGLPALPIARSAAVILGEVTRAESQLSEDETNIFSEFTVQIEDVLKNDNNSLSAGSSVVVERFGGRLRMPSGKVVVSRTYKQDLPRTGKRYLFFLTKDGEDFRILTGYELRNGLVFPLDKLRPSHPITAYSGTSETSFFSELNKILVNSSTSQSR